MDTLRTEARKLEHDTGERRSPLAFRDYTHLYTIMWCLKGKHSWAEDWQKEQQALVELGYFQQRELTLSNRQVPFRGPNAQLDPAVQKAFFGGLDSPWFVAIDQQRPYWVRVTGTNLDAFEEIIKRWDAQGAR